MWSAYKTLDNVVTDVLFNNRIDKLIEFETCLKRHRTPLLFPMHKTSKSAEDRQSVKKADVDAIAISGLSQRIILTHDLIDETCNFSDLFDINEITALEFLLTAEGHLSSHSSGLNRSALAITLYFDAHRALSEVLNSIIRRRPGRMPPSSPLSKDVESVVSSFTDDLWQCGLLNNLLSFLAKFNVESELKRLETSRVLDGRQHRRDIRRILIEIRNRIAESVMLWATQTPLTLSEMDQVLTHLVGPKSNIIKGIYLEEDVSVPLDHGSIHLFMALLFALEPFGTPGIVIDQCADANEQDLQHPLFSKSGYVTSVTELLTFSGELDQQTVSLAVEGLYGLLQIAWGIALRRTAHLRADLRRRRENSANAGSENVVDEDDLVTSALRSRALEFLSNNILSELYFSHEPLWVCRVHSLLTELLIQFPQNTRELRLWDESVVRRMGVDPGGFAVLLDALGRLYNVPGSPLHARLSLEYWWPAGETHFTPAEASDTLNTSFRAGEIENSRQAVLFRFVYSTSEFASSPTIFVPYVRMLRSLVGCQTSANLCFNLLKATASSGGRLASLLTWDHFISSLHQYLEHLKRATVLTSGVGMVQPLHLQHPYLYHHSAATIMPEAGDSRFIQQQTYQQQLQQHEQSTSTPLEIQPEELEALRIVVALITRVCVMDPVASSTFASNTKWCLISTAIGLITCPLPVSMKADLLHLLSALSRTPAVAAEVWCALVDSRLLSFIEQPSSVPLSASAPISPRSIVGLHTEMDKAEARLEEYPITQAFLNLLTTLAPSLMNSAVGSNELTPSLPEPWEALSRLIHFTIDTIFLKHTMRAYRRQNERWEVAASCVVLFEGLVSAFLRRMRSVAILTAGAENCSDEQLALFDWTALLAGHYNAAKLNLPRGWPFTDPGYQVVTQLLTNSSLFSLLTGLLEVGLYRLLEYSSSSSSCAMVRATAAILRLFEHILPHEQMVVNLVRRAALVIPHLRPDTAWSQKSGADVVLPILLSRLLVVTINSRTGRADLLVTIVRYCGVSDDLPDHCNSALNILYNVVRTVQPHKSVLAVFTNDKKSEKDLLRALVSCLTTSLCDLSDNAEEASVGTPAIFSDSWLYNEVGDDAMGTAGCYPPNPALKVARSFASFPIMPCDWDFSESRWEFMASFPSQNVSSRDMTTGVLRELDVIWSLGHWHQGQGYSIRSTMLRLILYALTNHPSPSIAHWLLGFRCQNPRSIALTTLQDAGVGGFPRTCLHALLDLLELAVASLRVNAVSDLEPSPLHPSLLSQQFDAAISWQILYHLMAATTTTAVPVSRYLRGNHDFIGHHLTTGLVRVLTVFSSSTHLSSSSEDSANCALQSLILNQCSWLLKMAAIEVQSSTSQRTYLARLLINLFATHENIHAADAGVEGSGHSFLDSLFMAVPYSDLGEPQSRVLPGLLSSIAPSKALVSPQWVFDRDCAESKLMEDIVIACEEAFPLISAEEQVSLRSGVINTTSLASRLNIFLSANAIATGTSPKTVALLEAAAEESDIEVPGVLLPTAAGTSTRLAADVMDWARRRNAHRLVLVAGKQACLEGWRHITEIGLHMLHFMARTSPDAFTLTAPTGAITGTGSAVNRNLYATTMTLLKPLLCEISAPESAPAVLKVLASGSCLTLTAFLQIFASPTPADGSILSPKLGGTQSILSVTQLLLDAVLTSKPTQQRVRANYYGALCYVLDVCYQFDRQMSASGVGSAMETSIALQAINILSGGDGDGASSSFLTVLFADISSGHHPIIPISALALLCLLLKLDRASGQIMETVIRDGCLQFCVDSLEDDLAILQRHLISQEDTSAIACKEKNEIKDQTDATAVFYVYQAKMALLTLLSSTQLGAKVIVQTPLLDSTLCRFEPLSASCLADTFNFSVANLRSGTPSNEAQLLSLSWLDTYEISQHLIEMLNRQELAEPTVSSSRDFVDPLVTSQLLCIPGSSLGVSGDPGQCLTWTGILTPVLAFSKSLLFTLGPSHVSAVRKVSKLLYTHSDALLTVGASGSAARLVFALTQECFQEEENSGSADRQEQLIQVTLQWLQGEEGLSHLLSFILRSRIPSSLEEPDDLPRELLRSKILRHVFVIMPELLQTLQIREHRNLNASNVANDARQIFLRNLVTTRQLQLLRLLVGTCVAAVSNEDELDGFDVTAMKNIIFSSSLSPNESGSDISLLSGPQSGRPGLHLLLQLVTWSASRLHILEGLANTLTRHLPPSLLDGSGDDGQNERESTKATSLPSLDKVLRCLVQLPITVCSTSGEISTDSLRQIATSVFSVWIPVAGPLLQTDATTGIDTNQRNAYLRRFIALGGGLLQIQLACFIDILEQSAYLLWRHLACFLATVSKSEVQTQLDGTRGTPRRSSSRVANAELIEQLPRKLSFDVLDSITQVSKATYLSSSDQLFLQVMVQRLERISQTKNRSTVLEPST